MAGNRTSIHGQWSSRWAFILAATGSAVGLGNIWRFPYLTGENGGGVFVMVYLVCVFLVGVPILMAEVMLGRRGRQSPINTMKALAADENKAKSWQIIGWIGMLTGFLILSFYSVIAGWTLAYVVRTASGVFVGAEPALVASTFDELISDPERLLAWHTIFMMMVIIVVSRGVKSGLEQAVRYLMPTLFILLLVMVGYAMTTEKFMEGMRYLFVVDFDVIRQKIEAGQFFGDVFLNALGQAFFSLSLGMGAIMVYGSYLSSDSSIPRTSIIIALADTGVALLAGIAIFPIVFTYGLEPSSGPGLIFVTLTVAFAQMPGGAFFGTLFFCLLMFAAWTSAISILEPAVAWLVEHKNMTRVKASAIAGLAAWLLGVCTVLSFSHWAFSFPFAGQVKTGGLFDVFDTLASNILLPLGGLLIAIFAAWVMSTDASAEELGLSNTAYKAWQFAARFIAPAGVILIFLNAIGFV
ncbi:MAG: NSS family neurotransmitter:Na+ symporter [Gammaproteobacteria bacterium]|jgi:NSS family neurotransmitter:Na+ symporter